MPSGGSSDNAVNGRREGPGNHKVMGAGGRPQAWEGGGRDSFLPWAVEQQGKQSEEVGATEKEVPLLTSIARGICPGSQLQR